MADTRGSRAARFPGMSIGCRRGCYTISSRSAARSASADRRPPTGPRPLPMLPAEIFKAYDIRGIVGRTLTPAIVRVIGQALGSLAAECNRDTSAVGRDGRL